MLMHQGSAMIEAALSTTSAATPRRFLRRFATVAAVRGAYAPCRLLTRRLEQCGPRTCLPAVTTPGPNTQALAANLTTVAAAYASFFLALAAQAL
eukprot:279584-Chlamydomonas_euryale.AAC.1